jgi:glycosyltransferase involved in cell wall biosynthesis
MKIAFVGFYPDECRPARGGVEVAAAGLAEALVQRGHHVTAIAPGPHQDYVLNGVHVRRRPADRRLGASTRWIKWRHAAHRELAETEPDIVHGQSLMLGGLPAVTWRRSPAVVTAHGDPRRDATHGLDPHGLRIRWRIIEHRVASVARSAHCVISPCPTWRVHFDRAPTRFAFIPHMAESGMATGRRLEERDAIVAFAGGGMRPIKGFELLRKAWPIILKTIPDARLDLIGWEATPPPNLPAIVQPVDRSVIDRQSTCRRLADASVLVIPSVFEVAPIAVVDAWSVGTPVVVTPVGGLPAMVGDGGLLCAETPESVADATITALRGGHNVEQIVARGSERAAQCSRDRVVGEHERLYEEIVAGWRRDRSFGQ